MQASSIDANASINGRRSDCSVGHARGSPPSFRRRSLRFHPSQFELDQWQGSASPNQTAIPTSEPLILK